MFPGRHVAAIVLLIAIIAPVLVTVAARAAEYEDIYYPPARYGPEQPLSEIIDRAGLTLDPDRRIPSPRVEIVKSSYQLRLFSGDSLLKTYRIQLGRNAHGAKSRRYDGRTPVGSYHVCSHNKWSKYYMSLQLDYPNEADIAGALKARRINARQAESLRAALASGRCPSGRTRLGGEVFIHGQHPKMTREVLRHKRRPGSRSDLQPGDIDPAMLKVLSNWTAGCIALSNVDIRELYRYLPDGTPVEIRE